MVNPAGKRGVTAWSTKSWNSLRLTAGPPSGRAVPNRRCVSTYGAGAACGADRCSRAAYALGAAAPSTAADRTAAARECEGLRMPWQRLSRGARCSTNRVSRALRDNLAIVLAVPPPPAWCSAGRRQRGQAALLRQRPERIRAQVAPGTVITDLPPGLPLYRIR